MTSNTIHLADAGSLAIELREVARRVWHVTCSRSSANALRAGFVRELR